MFNSKKSEMLIVAILLTSSVMMAAGLSSCAHDTTASDRMKLMDESEIESTVESESDKAEIYSGLYNTLTMAGTLVNSKVNEALLNQQARMYQWDDAKMTSERTKSEEKMKLQTEVFLSFYTPERKHDDLNKNQTLWKIFLDVDGKRYEGKATKIKLLTTEVHSLYPYHNRFSTPYSISFPVSTKSIESKPSVLTVTGPVGSAQLKFK